MKITAVRSNFTVPCPLPGSGFAGWAVEGIGSPAFSAPVLTADGKGLAITAGGKKLTLTGCVRNGWIHAANGGIHNIAMEAPEGEFLFLSEKTQLTAAGESDCCLIYRAETPMALRDTVCYTDLYFRKDRPVITVLTYFDAGLNTPYRELQLCGVTTEDEGIMLYSDNEWKVCGAEPVYALSGQHTWSDLYNYDALHPFVTHIRLDGNTDNLPEVILMPEYESGNRTVKSGDLTVTLNHTACGLGLRSVTDTKSGDLLRPTSDRSLFTLLLRSLSGNREIMLNSLSGWDTVLAEKHTRDESFLFENEDLQVRLTALLKEKDSAIEWELEVVIRNGDLTCVRFDPPAFCQDEQEDTMGFVALGPGRVRPFTKGLDITSTDPYPSICICMQYMAYWRPSTGRGIYYGLHDPAACHKTLTLRQHAGYSSLHAMVPCRGIGEAANSFRMDGSVVWRLFNGDWYDATLIYKEWVHRYAQWFTGVRNEDRKDVPEWMRTMPLWFNVGCNEGNEWVYKLFEAADDIGVPAGAHMYTWHEIPFDTNYPHYNPAKPGVAKMMPVLQAHGIRAMPYINGRLWDTHDRGDFDYQFSSYAKPAVTKGPDGAVITEHYESRNTKGERVELGVMCPSTAIWQEKQLEINNWILNTLGCDAVYVDQIAAAPAVNCLDRTHAHRPGGGSWWYEHYYNLIDHINLHAPEGKGFTTESNAEPFVGHIGGMLVWHWAGDGNVPAFPAVYAGYQTMFGRNYGAPPKEDTLAFRVQTAQSLCFGEEMGWLSPDFYLNHPYRDFFRRAVRIRAEYGEYFYEGSCLRPPKTEGEVPVLSSGFLSSPAVLTGMWKREKDGEVIVVLVNVTEDELHFDVEPEGFERFSCTLAPLEIKVVRL